MQADGQAKSPSRKLFNAFAVAILAVVLVVSWRAFPRAPHRIVILAGEPGGSYHAYGERYARYLHDNGLSAEVVETEGSLENLGLLASDTRAAVGFAQSGVEAELEDDRGLDDLVSLGSLSFEPVWLFVREGSRIDSADDLVGQRLGLGPRGSGSWAIAEMLLADNDLADRTETVAFDHLDPVAVAEALTSGEVDIVCLVGEPRSTVIAALLGHPGLAPASLPRTAAYARRHRELAELTLPEGAFDMARDIPSSDLRLLAAATNLVARDDLHPAVVGLLLQAAQEINRPASLFAEEGTFPSTRYSSLPISSTALTYLAHGEGLVYRFLPFWLAGLVSWLVQLVTPPATVALFLFKIVPGWKRLRFDLRVRKFFKRLERLEKARAGSEEVEELLRRLDQLDRDSVNMRVPRGETGSYFEFRQALHDMRDRLTD